MCFTSNVLISYISHVDCKQDWLNDYSGQVCMAQWWVPVYFRKVSITTITTDTKWWQMASWLLGSSELIKMALKIWSETDRRTQKDDCIDNVTGITKDIILKSPHIQLRSWSICSWSASICKVNHIQTSEICCFQLVHQSYNFGPHQKLFMICQDVKVYLSFAIIIKSEI